MQSFPSTILVPLDGSTFAERAIEPARKLAAMLNFRVGVVQCVGEADRGDTADDSYLEVVTQERHLGWYQVAEYNDVPAGILAAAKERNAMVCMSTHGHGRAEVVMGSRAEEILRRCDEGARTNLPVVLVGRAYEPDSPQKLRSLVAPLDGTTRSETVCEFAVQWAIRLELALRFVTVVEEGESGLDHSRPPRFGPLGDPKEYIDAVVKKYQRPGLVVTGEILFDPLSPASGLSQLLRDGLDSLVVMTTRFRTGMQRLLHGSHAGDIIDTSPVMILLYQTLPGENGVSI
jgi:nucleotide-binding universal stress UspA family protein